MGVMQRERSSRHQRNRKFFLWFKQNNEN